MKLSVQVQMIAALLTEQLQKCTFVLRRSIIPCNDFNWPLQLHHIQAFQSLLQMYSADMVKWIGGRHNILFLSQDSEEMGFHFFLK